MTEILETLRVQVNGFLMRSKTVHIWFHNYQDVALVRYSGEGTTPNLNEHPFKRTKSYLKQQQQSQQQKQNHRTRELQNFLKIHQNILTKKLPLNMNRRMN